jgi:hypothetical protein
LSRRTPSADISGEEVLDVMECPNRFCVVGFQAV